MTRRTLQPTGALSDRDRFRRFATALVSRLALALGLALLVAALPVAAQADAQLSVTLRSKTSARVTLSGYHGEWSIKVTTKHCISMLASVKNLNIKSLVPGTVYTANAYAGRGCKTSPIASVSFTTLAPIAASDVTHDSATLTLSSWSNAWRHKRTSPDGGTCSSEIPAGTDTASLDGLSGNTSYSYKAYVDSDCSASEDLTAPVSFLTKPAKPGTLTVRAGVGSGKLALSSSVSGGSGALTRWQYTTDDGTTWENVSNSTSTTLSHTVSGLTDGTSYTFKVRAVNATGDGPASDASASVAPTTAALSVGNVQKTTATLTVADHSGDWYYKQTSPSGGECSSAQSGTTASLDGLSGNTDYIFKAYGDGSCTTAVTNAASFLTKPGKPDTPAAAKAGSQKLLVTSSVSGGGAISKWQIAQKSSTDASFGGWSDLTAQTSTSLSHTVSGLDNAKTYQFKVRAVNATGTSADSEESTAVQPAAATLTASGVGAATATLTIANHLDDWHYKQTSPSGGQCSSAQTGTTASLGDLSGNTDYTFKAYSDSSCSTELAAASAFLTKPGRPDKPTATAGVGSGKLALTSSVSGGSGALTRWQYTTDDGTTWENVSNSTSTTLSHTVSGLTDGTSYTFKVRAVNATGTGDASEASNTATPTTPALSVDNVQKTAATLTIGNWSGAWHYKQTSPSGGQCSSEISAGTANLDGLTSNTSYTFKAYGDSGCSNELAAVAFRTQEGTRSWQQGTGGVSPADTTLTADSEEATTATLAIGNWSGGDWYYKYTSPSGGECSSAQSGTTANLENLSGNTSYTFSAYKDSSCATELATASAFLTKPGKPAKPVAAAGAGSGKLTLASSVTGDGTLTGWQYTTDDGTTWEDIQVTSTSLSYIVSGLTDGTNYQFKVRAVNATGDGVASEASDAATPAASVNHAAWLAQRLARFGRSVAGSHVDAVRDRLKADRSPGFSGRLAGQPLPGPEAGSGELAQAVGADGTGTGQAQTPSGLPEEDGFPAFRSFLAVGDDGEDGPETQTLTADDVLLGTAFTMTRESGTGLSRSFWGRASRSGFSGRDGNSSLDGEVTGVMLGTDWKRKGTLLGLILSRSRGTATYDGTPSGTIDATLTGLVPYAGREVGDGLSVWGAAGAGRGEMTVTPDDGDAPAVTGIGWSMAAAGADGALASGERFGGADLGWHADALWTRTTSEAAAGLAASAGTTTRLRLGLSAGWERTLASGATLRPRIEAGLRNDGGDAETGSGLEIGGGIGFRDPARGLSVSLDGRTLALHEDGGFRDWGAGFSVSYDPRGETKRGLSVLATRTLGGASSGGVDALLGPEAFPGHAGTEGEGDWSLEAAYGTGRGRGMVGSPYGRAGGTGGVDSLRLGYRIEPDAAHAADASLDLWAEPGTGGDGHEAGAGLQWRW